MAVVYIVTQSAVTDIDGVLIDYAEIIAVCRSRQRAEWYVAEALKKYNYGRTEHDYEIETHEIEE
jgi:phosphoglycolate phosphatase-like HAD superfamily hydrolase